MASADRAGYCLETWEDIGQSSTTNGRRSMKMPGRGCVATRKRDFDCGLTRARIKGSGTRSRVLLNSCDPAATFGLGVSSDAVRETTGRVDTIGRYNFRGEAYKSHYAG